VHRGYPGGDRQAAVEQGRFDILDDRTELDADGLVLLGHDQGLRIVAHRGEKLGMAYSQGSFPGLGEGLRGDELRYSFTDH
jgi:hypothetical protein